jgi:hypothetical protein
MENLFAGAGPAQSEVLSGIVLPEQSEVLSGIMLPEIVLPGKAPSAKKQFGQIFSGEVLTAGQPAYMATPVEKSIPGEFAFTEDLSRNLAVFCSDERFIDASLSFLKNILKLKKFDLIVTAGGPAFITADVPALMGNLSLLKEEHNISTIVLISHEDCKYYVKKYANSGSSEIIKCQQKDLQDAKQKVLKLYPGLKVEIYFARIAGSEIIFENQS